MPAYRTSGPAVTAQAARAGITPTARGIARSTGFARATVARIMRGTLVSELVAAAFAAELGTTREHLFKPARAAAGRTAPHPAAAPVSPAQLPPG
jgi:hypothetical protein